MSRTSWIALAIAGVLGASSQASAQGPVAAPAPCPCGAGHATAAFSGNEVGNGLAPIAAEGTVVGAPGSIVPGGPAAAQVGPIHPYSYYVNFPAPSRTYVPYGPTDTFTYQGQAYGHAYDRWTWPAMSGASGGLGRYYQILR